MEDSVTFATHFQQNYANVREKGYFQGVIHKNRIDKKNFSLTKKIGKIKIDNARTKKVFYTLFIRPPFFVIFNVEDFLHLEIGSPSQTCTMRDR